LALLAYTLSVEVDMASIEIPPALAKELEAAANRTGKQPDEIVHEAIVRYLEDIEDLAAAEEALNEPGRRVSLEELERELGLGD
jgi:RHH-type transcriptional regulator, rel operon repressor / antitoxin RelB